MLCLLLDFLYSRMEAFVGISMLLASGMVIHTEKEIDVCFKDGWMNE